MESKIKSCPISELIKLPKGKSRKNKFSPIFRKETQAWTFSKLFYIPSKKLNLIKNSSWQYFGTSKRTKGVKKNSPTAILDSTSKRQWVCHVSDYNMSPFIASLPFSGEGNLRSGVFFFFRERQGITGREHDFRLRGRQWDGQSVGRSWRRGGDDFFSIFPGPDFVLCCKSRPRLVSPCRLNYFQSSSFTALGRAKGGRGRPRPGWREKETRIEV